jgi:GT2 family glycosyltransferase
MAGVEEERERLRKGIADRDREIAARDLEIGLLRQQVAELADRTAESERVVQSLQSDLAGARRALWRVGRAVTWQVLPSLRGKVYFAAGGERSPLVRLIRLLQAAWARLRRPWPIRVRPAIATASFQDASPVELPQFHDPDVSIVIAVHAHAELTHDCLASIRDNAGDVTYEVIAVDDMADHASKALLRSTKGARIVSNDTNLGFLRSVNRGAAEARGRWLVVANNDIVVCEGWLSAMLGCAESAPDIGVVTPKYLFPDGRLSEAGGLIWRDGTGVNYGRKGDPLDCRYEFRREVDYGSAAALMVKADFWRAVGGFDERFVPMYYEDTDLCFQARKRGLRVLYEPRAQVIHIEGATAGTSVRAGHKRHQQLNRPKFVEKWRRELERDHLPASFRNRRLAANRHRGPGALIIDHRVPRWDRDSGSLRLRGMIETLIELGCQVTFLPDNLLPAAPYTAELQRLGVEVWYGKLDLDAQLSAIGPGLALVLLSRPEPASRWIDRVRKHAPSAAVVYDTVELHWLREARRAAARSHSDEQVLGPLAVTFREMELALIRAADTTLAVSEEERVQIEVDVPGASVHVVPNVHELKEDVAPAETRSGVLFLGGFEHPPNVEAAVRLVEHVMPLVWHERPQVHVKIVGGDVPQRIRGLASPNVEVTGWVPDIDPLIDGARVLAAPLSFGAGLKGKVTQALADGLPVVTTPVGAEGLPAVNGEHVLIGADDMELAQHLLRVLDDDALWSRLSTSGQELAGTCCSRQLLSSRLGELLAEVQATAPGRERRRLERDGARVLRRPWRAGRLTRRRRRAEVGRR